MTLKRWLGTVALLATAGLLVYLGVGVAGVWLYYDHPDNAVLAGGKAVMVALAPLLSAAGLVFGAVALSRRHAVVVVIGVALVIVGFLAAAGLGASSVR